MRIATLRFHWVVPTPQVSAEALNEHKGAWKDLWGWVSVEGVARSILLGLVAPTTTFPENTHETFFIVAPTTCQQLPTMELLRSKYPDMGEEHLRKELIGNAGLFDCSKAKRMLGWEESGFPMST